jgi:hypothetical protein
LAAAIAARTEAGEVVTTLASADVNASDSRGASREISLDDREEDVI